jgi:peptidoglycan/LPS O-acetylase OafA/YrhL
MRQRDFSIGGQVAPLGVGLLRSAPDAVAAPAQARDFIVSLESIRGLAALSVALFHSFHVIPVDGSHVYSNTLWNVPTMSGLLMRLIMVPFNGGAAVSLFFVLSGFVLALSLKRDDRSGAPKAWGFASRRFFRIYPPLAINVVLFTLVIWAITAWFPVISVQPLSISQLVTNLLLTDYPVNGATWSLMIELVAIPFLLVGHYVARRWGATGLMALVGLGLVTLFLPRLMAGKLISQFAFMFFLGMLVAEIWLSRSAALNKTTATIWLIAAITVMLTARFLVGYGSRWSLLLEGFASAALIAALVLGPRLAIHDVLERAPLRFLGRISYSYYLYHPLALGVFFPILILVSPSGWLDHPFPAGTALAVSTAGAAVFLGYGSFILTEKPMIKLSPRF